VLSDTATPKCAIKRWKSFRLLPELEAAQTLQLPAYENEQIPAGKFLNRRLILITMEVPPSSDHLAHVQGLFVQQMAALRGFVVSLVSDFTLVDDILQETFITVTQKATDYQRGTNFRAWVMRIARYKTLQLLQKARPASDRFSPEVIEALCSHEESEDWQMEHQLRQLATCLEQLAPKAKQMVELRYQQAHRPPEIARRVGWTVDAVHVALSKARIALRDCVSKKLAQERI
jgi:RNA polymerase sigma-70 factor, ECF subfamily